MATRGKPAFTPETDATIAIRLSDGEHYLALAQEFGCSVPSIYAARKRHLKKVAGGARTPSSRDSLILDATKSSSASTPSLAPGAKPSESAQAS